MKRFQKGFTLIELLAVIAIIGILAALILVSLSKARMQARDTQRKSITRAIAQAEESYYNNSSNGYATSTGQLDTYLTGNSSGAWPTWASTTPGCWTTVATPWSTTACFTSSASGYTITTRLEANNAKGFQCTTGGNCKDI